MKDFILNNSDLLLVIAAILLSFMVIKLVTKILFKLIIVIAVLTGSFIIYQVFSGTNIIDSVTVLYCENQNINEVKCKCFVEPIILDLKNRFNEQELIDLKSKKLRANTEFIKSYKLQEDKIKTCFNNENSNSILEEVLRDIKNGGLKILK
tara:strand:- start:1256 stop:1708 length:453 start_codon:yes stop_codon:yes gene_type:complete